MNDDKILIDSLEAEAKVFSENKKYFIAIIGDHSHVKKEIPQKLYEELIKFINQEKKDATLHPQERFSSPFHFANNPSSSCMD